MRKVLLVGCVWLALGEAARAQVATFDAANALSNVKAELQSLKAYAQQLQDYIQYVRTAESALQIANGIVHNPENFSAYLALGNMAGVNLQSSLPIDPYSAMALVSGYGGRGVGGMLGKLNTLGNLVNTNADVNAVNVCTAQTFACQLQSQRRYAAAGQQAAAQQVLQDMNNHLTALAALKARCLASPDAKDSADCGNQIAVETAAIQADTAQLQAVQAMASAQQNVFDNRASEWMKGQQLLTAAQPGGG